MPSATEKWSYMTGGLSRGAHQKNYVSTKPKLFSIKQFSDIILSDFLFLLKYFAMDGNHNRFTG